MNANPLNVIQEADPDLFKVICESRETAFKDGQLSKKHKLLIALAIDTALRAENGIRSLALQAMECGATKQEILETLRIANYICGAATMYPAAAALKDVLK